MTQSIDAAKAAALITQAEAVRTQLQMFIDALKTAAGEQVDSGDGIAHPIQDVPPP